MFKTILALAALMIIATAVACGNSQQPTSGTQGQIATIVPAPDAGNQQQVEMPTPAQPIPGITDPTPAPTPKPRSPEQPIALAQPGQAPVSATTAPKGGNNPSEPTVQAPQQGQEKPGQFNELQVTNVYAGMDLDQFAITREQWEAMKIPAQTRETHSRDREEKGNHHYGHMAGPSPTTYQSTAQFGPRHFLENPWFIYIIESGAVPPYTLTKLGAAHLARKSTMGILAQAVAEGLESRIKPGVEPYPIHLFAGDHPKYLDREEGTRVKNMKEYLQQANEGPENSTYFTKPTSHWEFIHPELPIVRVVVEHEVSLPLAQSGGKPEVTKYQAGFVISFQNRWQSFDDPNRWLLRFRNTPTLMEIAQMPEFWDLETSRGQVPNKEHITWMNPEWDIAPEAKYGHRFWHHTDYMQHQLIGPVWINVLVDQLL